MVLTHRLLVSEGNDASGEAFANCMIAANEIAHILKIYSELYDPTSATFVLSYATYISAKVHLHNISILNTPTRGSSLESLQFCLNALDEHQKLYTAAVRAKETIVRLMARLKINIGGDSNSVATTGQLSKEQGDPTLSKDGHETSQGEGSARLARAVPPARLGVDNIELLNMDSGLESSHENTASLDQEWLSDAQFMVFDDLYYNFSQ
ncbi:hypothetical protein H9Q73_004132 [Fusarium xylarioides]|nr:hypothetical protein H9Q73_004132 [Fusarium xylarioides]